MQQLHTPLNEVLSAITEHCTQYLLESEERPLYKHLPTAYGDWKRVKVRHKHNDPLSPVFECMGFNARHKSIIAHGTIPTSHTETESLYYVFPVDGYDFLYSTEIVDSTQDIKTVIKTLFSALDPKEAADLVKQVLKYTYTDVMLAEGLRLGTEIMLFNVPAFYAVKANGVEYSNLLKMIKK